MSKFTLVGEGLKTQSVEAVRSMVEYLQGNPCKDLPANIRLANGWQLIRSSKGDAYYMTNHQNCSCPGFHYQGSCEHVKAIRDQDEQKLSPSQELARNIVEAMES